MRPRAPWLHTLPLMSLGNVAIALHVRSAFSDVTRFVLLLEPQANAPNMINVTSRLCPRIANIINETKVVILVI